MSVRPLSKELGEKAEHELNELPEQIHQHIATVKSWLQENELGGRTDDQWIISFLRGCKFNHEKTKGKLEFFYTMRSRSPEFFTNRDPLLPEMQDILNRGILLFLPNTADAAGAPILMVRWSEADPATVSFKNLIKISLMSLEILMNENDNFVVAGQQILQDFEGFSIRYLAQMTPGICSKCISFLQTAYPTRIKGVHFVNVPIYFRIIYNIVNPFLNKKLRSRVNVYSEPGVNGLSDDVPLSVLPNEYGGEGGLLDDLKAEWKRKVESYRDWFLNEDQ